MFPLLFLVKSNMTLCRPNINSHTAHIYCLDNQPVESRGAGGPAESANHQTAHVCAETNTSHVCVWFRPS